MMYKTRVISWIIALYVAYIICSVVPDILPDVTTRYIPIAIISICCIFYSRDCFGNKSFICACIYSAAIYIVSNYHLLSGLGYGHGGTDTVLIDLGFTLPSVALGAVLYKEKEKIKTIRFIDIFIYASIIISACWMIPTLLTERSIARRIARMDFGEMSNELLELNFGYWDYTMCHIIALYFALFWGLFTTSRTKTQKILFGILIAITVFYIFNLTITTTFVYFFVVIALLLYQKFKRFSLFGFLLLILGSYLFIINIDSIIDYMWINYHDTDMATKISDFRDILSGGRSYHISIDDRANFQQDALYGFVNNMIIGSEYRGGGHSVLLTRLGTTGLFGFIPFVLMIYFIFIQWYRTIPESSRFYYLLSWLGVLILLYNKNTFGSAGFCFICITMPCLCLTFRNTLTLKSMKISKKRYS